MSINNEMQSRELVQVRAILLDLLHLLAELHERNTRCSDQRGAAVDDGSTACSPAGNLGQVRFGLREGHVLETRDPVVLPNHSSCHEVLHVSLSLTPCEVTLRAARLLEADGKLRYAVRHQQRLLRVTVGKVGSNTDDGCKLCSVQDRDAVVYDLPESLVLCLQCLAHGHGVIAHHGNTGARAEDVLRHRSILFVRAALEVVIRWRRMDALTAP
mmetsp:Transcript_16714/g.36651  ORF Transcript_16714/g.36651 Transcript_16714/m.36651 type:complete len:214 (+) Transcript_16714:484-1125(+)